MINNKYVCARTRVKSVTRAVLDDRERGFPQEGGEDFFS